MKTLFIIATLGCFLLGNHAIAQTGVMVHGDVYVAPLAQIAVFGEVLTVEANLLGEGEVIMAAPTSQTINAKGHSISRLTIRNPAGVDMVSDLVVTRKLHIPQGELRLLDAKLTVPNTDVIAHNDRRHIRVVGHGVLVVETEFRPDNRPLTAGGRTDLQHSTGDLPTTDWITRPYYRTDGNARQGVHTSGQESIYQDIDDPPPKSLSDSFALTGCVASQ